MQTIFQAGDIAPLLWRDVGFLALAAAYFLGITASKTRRHLD